MRTALAIGALLLAAMPASAAGVFPYPYETHKLDNGLEVILVPMHGSGLVSYYSVVRTGSRDEVEPGHTGFAHFFEHMMFRGTEKYPAAEYDRIITSLGADANAYTTDDYTCYYMTCPGSDLAQVVDIESDRFQNLSYAEPDFQTEAGAVYGEYRKNRTSPFAVLEEAIADKAFDVHTYKHTTMGFEKDIAAMPTMYDYSKSFFTRYYRPDNVILLVTGDFDPKQALALITEHYAQWKPGYVAPDVQAEPEQKAERSVDVPYEGRSLPLLTLAWKSTAFDADSRELAAGMLLGELAFGETSQAYRELVLEKRLVQRMFSDFGMTRDPSLWSLTAMIGRTEDVPAVQQALDAAVARLHEAPPDAKQLDDLKRRARYAFLMRMDTPAHVASGLARFLALGGGIEVVDQRFAALAAVTPGDVQQAARKFLARERRTVAVLKGVAS